MIKPRVLIDTNVLLSGLIWNGNEAHLLEMSISGTLHLLIPEFVLEEARRVLMRKFPAQAEVVDGVLGTLDHEVLPRPASQSLCIARKALRDVNDAEILASIIECKPDYAVTGDKDLLTPEVQTIFRTSTCRDFLRNLEDEN